MRWISLKRRKVKDCPMKCPISIQHGKLGEGNGEKTVEMLKRANPRRTGIGNQDLVGIWDLKHGGCECDIHIRN